MSDAATLATAAWSARLDPALPGAVNMARDHALALGLSAGSAVLRLYRWERPTLSLGRNEPARSRWDRAALARLGVDVVRRPTGGHSVLHARELTYAVAAPARALGGVRAAYRWINVRLAAALASLGIAAEIAPEPSVSVSPDGGPCFRAAAGGEVVVGGRKLIGSAQLKVGDTFLQHGSILIGDDQALLAELGGGPAAEGDRPAALAELLGRPLGQYELEMAVLTAFGLAGSCPVMGGAVSPVEAELEERYRSEAWTWRR